MSKATSSAEAMRLSRAKTLTRAGAGLAATLVLISLRTTSAQYFAARVPVHQPAYYHPAALPRSFAHWHDLVADLDDIFSALDLGVPDQRACARPSVQVKEQLKTDDNQTSHLHLSVRRHDPCTGEDAVPLTDFNVSVSDSLLTVTANSTHGAFVRKYHLPEHAATERISAVYTNADILHIQCPVNVPPLPETLLIDVTIEPKQDAEVPPGTADSRPMSPLNHTEPGHVDGSGASTASPQGGRSPEPRLDVDKHIKALEADLARLKGMM